MKFGHTVSFRNVKTLDCSIPIDTHSTNVHNMTIYVIFHDCHGYVLCSLGVVGVGVVDSFQRFHGVGSSSLFSQMHDYIRIEFFKSFKEFFLLGSNIDISKLNVFACHFLPGLDSLFNSLDGSDATIPIFLINEPPGEIIDNQDFPSKFRHP